LRNFKDFLGAFVGIWSVSVWIAVRSYRWAIWVNIGAEEMKYPERLLLGVVEGRRPKLGDEDPHTSES
jgi:hypothetical protein